MTKDALPDYMTFDRKKIGLDLLTALGLTTAIAVITTSCDSVRVPGGKNSLERTSVAGQTNTQDLEGRVWCDDEGTIQFDEKAQKYISSQAVEPVDNSKQAITYQVRAHSYLGHKSNFLDQRLDSSVSYEKMIARSSVPDQDSETDLDAGTTANFYEKIRIFCN